MARFQRLDKDAHYDPGRWPGLLHFAPLALKATTLFFVQSRSIFVNQKIFFLQTAGDSRRVLLQHQRIDFNQITIDLYHFKKFLRV